MTTYGSVVIDLEGLELTPEEHELIQHPFVGGIILFARNYAEPQQLTALCKSIRAIKPSMLIAVDQEGGRVQRCKSGLVNLPPAGEITTPEFAYTCGWVMASELLALGVDISFAPVLDLNKQLNTVIGDRAFHDDPLRVITLAGAYIHGMQDAGMAATGKHFPGHGSVTLDSHQALPVDDRTLNEIIVEDMQPFLQLREKLAAIMTAHIHFPQVDDKIVGFSSKWLQEILRKQYQFTGIIFSDDLNMQGAASVGNYADRAVMALEAGCDMILICNNRHGAIDILQELPENFSVSEKKYQCLIGKRRHNITSLHQSEKWQIQFKKFLQLGKSHEQYQ